MKGLQGYLGKRVIEDTVRASLQSWGGIINKQCELLSWREEVSMERKPEIWKYPVGVASYRPCESLAFTPKATTSQTSKTLRANTGDTLAALVIIIQ